MNPGDWYYIAVDDDYVSGRFTICITDQPTFNYWEGAIELAHDYGCSADAAYTNLAATADMLAGKLLGFIQYQQECLVQVPGHHHQCDGGY